ncbi:MAG: dTMP kinase [Parcubacteria group bacterium CG11_big_fil_rev_8_21_14_0_20_39_22]|nr:MAG: dTMP kinase [Parcubacteria group bacterium CG11_big_fil_rev_8_21_14_0_20_39_22]
MNLGKFIVIDGVDGAGKTLSCDLLKEKLPKGDFVFTREPGGAPFAEKIRELFLSESAKDSSVETQLALAFAARHDNLQNRIVPALRSGKNVISDRFDSSSFAFQVWGQERKDLRDFFFEIRETYLKEYKPDKYIFLDLDFNEGLRRISEKNGGLNRFDEESKEFHKRVAQGYREFAQEVENVEFLDSNRTPDMVVEDLVKVIDKS